MAWIDSEQMWRMETQKRSLSDISSDTEIINTYTEEGGHIPTDNTTKAIRVEPQTIGNVIVCREPPCHRNPPKFPNLAAYEIHHLQFHGNVCIECRIHLPTERLLSLHLEERHDPFAEAQRHNHTYKYKCYVDGCRELFKGVVQRNEHMIMFHYYPANYYFGVVKFGIDERDSMLVRQTFKQSWANPKVQGKAKVVQSDEMAVDTPITTKGNADFETEIQRGNAAKVMAGNGASGVPLGRRQGMRSSKPYTMPIFAFQRRGIGIETAKSKSHNEQNRI